MTRKRRHTSVRRKKRNTRKTARTSSRAKRGGGPNEDIQEDIKRKNLFRRTFVNFVLQLKNTKSRNDIKAAMNSLTKLLTKNPMINTLIPVTSDGRPVDKETYSLATKPVTIDDMVSPLTVIFDNLSDKLPLKDMLKLLETYYVNSGNFNALSSRFKRTPFMNEVRKRRVENVKLLLDKSQPYHIIEEGLDRDTKDALANLLPNEQQIMSTQSSEPLPRLSLPYPLPSNENMGYDKEVAPEFWKPLFKNGEELFQIRNKFWEMYKEDRYVDDKSKIFSICTMLETIIPGYQTRYALKSNETVKTLINTNILYCFTTLLYGIVLYKLRSTKQDYVFMFKGGRAIQLSLGDIKNIAKYFSEDTDLLIIPNQEVQATYQESLMSNLSGHLGYLVQWMLPDDLHVVISLPTNPKNHNKDITKVIYNDNTLFTAISDIGFGPISPDVRPFFEHLVYSQFYIEKLGTHTLFGTPTLDDMLQEKLYYYAKYMGLKRKLERGEPIVEQEYVNLTKQDVDFYLYKFKRSIIKLVEAVLKRDFHDATDLSKTDSSKLILRDLLKEYHDLSNQEKEDIVSSIFVI